MDLNIVYDNIEAERARHHLSIAECAKKLGINEKTYRQRLAKAQDIRISDLCKYAEIFNCSVDYLVGLSDKIRPA